MRHVTMLRNYGNYRTGRTYQLDDASARWLTATGRARDAALEAPPRAGAGSGRDAWADYADRLGIDVTDDMTRDDIVALTEESA